MRSGGLSVAGAPVGEVTSRTLPFAIGSIFNHLVQPLVGATRKDVVDVLEASRAAHPALDLFILEGGHAPRLLTGERERWS